MSEESVSELRASLFALDGRVEQLERQFSQTLMAVVKGLKGSDDGSTDGLYESVRKLRAEQASLHAKVSAVESTVGQHERDKNQVIGGGKATHLIVILGSGLLAWLITRFGK